MPGSYTRNKENRQKMPPDTRHNVGFQSVQASKETQKEDNIKSANLKTSLESIRD